MCGRYALVLRPSQIRRMLENDDMPVWDAPEDEGDGAPRQSYNFAPGYHGVVYRADTPDWGAGPRRERKAPGSSGSQTGAAAADGAADEDAGEDTPDDAPAAGDGGDASTGQVKYRLQSMKWGLVPFWTKRNPDYASMLRTINCRDDSLSSSGGMWTTMKARKRCIVIAQGFYEWLQKGPKEKVPHFIKRKDGQLMCFAGLWDCVQYEDSDDKLYTYTIITTDSNKQLKFLHDRMPVILEPGSDSIRTWLDPQRHEWSRELQALLKPFAGELEAYPVSKDVGKVGNNSPSFMVPIASRENKSNIANFFANAAAKKKDAPAKPAATDDTLGSAEGHADDDVKKEDSEVVEKTASGVKRGPTDGALEERPSKAAAIGASPTKAPTKAPPTKFSPTKASQTKASPTKAAPAKTSPRKISATSNGTKSPAKSKLQQDGSQKITKFFTK